VRNLNRKCGIPNNVDISPQVLDELKRNSLGFGRIERKKIFSSCLFSYYFDLFPVMGLSQSLTKAARIEVKFQGIGMLKFRMDQRRQIWSEPECSVVECDV